MARTARQLAASRRNIVKAQQASANSRRGKKRSNKSGHHYGTGKVGRKQARRNKYGSRKHGISIAQQTRRDRRARKYKRAGSVAFAVAATGIGVYSQLSPAQKSAVKQRVKSAPRDFKWGSKESKMVYNVNRQMGHNRRKSARASARFASQFATRR